ncbi:MAG: sulfite exporter TauE/SafE family protein [Gammaproteobacteria bacterium]|nr:sulfite exporter TauE/SafE family protein [Gammaproteobacteria bacterium]
MTSFIDISVLLTAFFVGLLGSGHCFGMCGGIAAGLGSLPVQNDADARAKPRALSAFLFNVGRILSYACLGLVSAWLLSRVGKVLNVPQWSMVLRFLTAFMIFLIGLQYLLNWNTLAFIEKAGAKVWKHVLPLAVRASSLPGGTGRLLLGLLWGLLPCGLVYSVLLTASAAGSSISGASVMLAFGIGTLPSMLGMSLAAPALAAMLNDRWTKKLMGAALILLAVISVSLMVIKMQGKQHHHHLSTSRVTNAIIAIC